MKKSFLMCVVVSAVVALGACSKKQVKEEGDTAGDASANPTALNSGAQAGSPIAELPAIHFPYDSFSLTGEAKKALDAHAAWMKANPSRNVQIEGHCDERGTNQYNMALGERRAGVVKDYLTGKGVAAGQLSTISYGEERPAVTGSDEAAWAKNRRAEFVNLGQ